MRNVSRPLPRLMSPRLPSVRGLATTLAVVSVVVTFYVGINVAGPLYVGFGGVL